MTLNDYSDDLFNRNTGSTVYTNDEQMFTPIGTIVKSNLISPVSMDKEAKPGDFISYSPPDYSWQRDALKQPLEFVYTPIHIPKEITNDMLIHNISFTFLEKLDMAWLLIKKAPALIKGFYIIYSSIERFKMTDLKTTILGIVQGILVVLGVIGVNVSPESTTTILTAIGSIFAVIEIIKGWFTKDKEKPKEVK